MSLSKFRKVPSFIDSADHNPSDSTQSQDGGKVKRRRLGRVWEKESTFESKGEALRFIEDENTWRIETTHNSNEGDKVNYCCKKKKTSARNLIMSNMVTVTLSFR